MPSDEIFADDKDILYVINKQTCNIPLSCNNKSSGVFSRLLLSENVHERSPDSENLGKTRLYY